MPGMNEPDTRKESQRGGSVYLKNSLARLALEVFFVGRIIGPEGSDSVSLAVGSLWWD